jgi:type IV pilus assembly protein PilN
MIEINLLPKELQYKRFRLSIDKNIIVLSICGAAIAALLVLYSFVFQASKLAGLENDILQAQNETAKYSDEILKIEDIKLKRDQIIARNTAVQRLEQYREYWVNLLEDLVQRIPDYVWLTSVEQNPSAGPQVAVPGAAPVVSKSTISGYSFSLNAFATFLVRLKKSEIFRDIELTSIKLEETEKVKAYSFSITCNFVKPELPMATEETAQSAPATGTQF